MSRNIIYIILLLIICLLLAFIIFRKEPPTMDLDNKVKVLEDSLAIMQKEIDLSHDRQYKLEKRNDSLSSLEPTIIYRTRDKIKFIYTDATIDELDSIIRASWKTKPGLY